VRILHLSSELPPTKVFGLGRFVHGLSRAQAAQGDRVQVITNSVGGAEDNVVIAGVEVHRIAFPNPPRPPDGHGEVLQFNGCLVACYLERRDRFRDVDVVVGHDWLTATAAREIARDLGRPLVTTFHDEIVGKRFGILDGESRFVRDLEALAAYDASHIIANSGYIAREIVRNYGVPRDRISAVLGGIDPEVLAVSAERRVPDVRSALAGPDDVLVGFVGRLDAEKGLDVLLDAVAALLDRNPQLRLALAGSGRLEGTLRAALAPFGGRARLLGYLGGEALSYFYRACDMVVVPSVYEPFGLVALEAMTAGAATIVTDAGGLPEILRDGEDGIVVPFGEPRGLAEAIEDLSADRSLRARFAASASKRARESFSWAAAARRSSDAYCRAIDASRQVCTIAPPFPPRPLVSVTIVTHNAPSHLETALRSLFVRTRLRPLEAIVVDNASAPAVKAHVRTVVAELRARGHEVRLLENGENLLFSKAQDQAIAEARGELICLLNDDTEVPLGSEAWLDGLVWLLESTDAGTVTPVTLQRDGSVYCAGAYGNGGHRLRDVMDGPGISSSPHRTEWNNMACMLTRKEHFARVGPLSTSKETAHYGSDRDWCRRLTEALGKAHLVHPARLFHFEKEALRVADAPFRATPDTRIPVSVVLVAYDGIQFTRAAVETILAHTAPPFELVLVDNGSRDGTRAFFHEVRDGLGGRIAVQVIENAGNLGYPIAANQGARAARGRHVVFLNNDTEVRSGWLAALLRAVDEEPGAGAVTAKILNLDGTVQNAGGILHHPDGSFTIPYANASPQAPAASIRREVENASGPCMLVTRAALERVGLFDESFSPGYFEDSDLCFRARASGLRVIFEPGAEVLHHGKGTSSIVAAEGQGEIWRRFDENKRVFHGRWSAMLARDEASRQARPPAPLFRSPPPGAAAMNAPIAPRRTRPVAPSSRRVFDSFIFFNELDLLEMRLRELESVVDVFVLVEATRTHANRPKPLHFTEAAARFSRWREKIRHIVVDDMPANPRSALEMEVFQRNAILRGLDGARPDDLVVISDVDEIPRPSVLVEFDGDAAALRMRMSYYRLNCVNRRGHIWDPWSVVVKRALLREPQALRDLRTSLPTIADAGWHFSYLGDESTIRRKVQSFSHQELNLPEFTDPVAIRRRMAEGRDLFDRPGVEWEYVPLDESFPASVLRDPGRWQHLIHQVPAPREASGRPASVGASR